MKLMQTQLDEANAEIAILRSQGTILLFSRVLVTTPSYSHIRNNTLSGFIDYGLKAMANHVGIQLFVAGLRPNLRDEIMKQMSITLRAAFNRAMEIEKISAGPPRMGQATVNAIDEEEEDRMDVEIEAIQTRLSTMINRRNFARGNHPNQNGSQDQVRLSRQAHQAQSPPRCPR